METKQFDRNKWVGTHTVHLKSWNPAFGLMSFYEVDNVAVRDEVHIKFIELFHKPEFSELIKESNNGDYFRATFEATDDYYFEDGPNHCGLAITELKWKGDIVGTSSAKKVSIADKLFLLALLIFVIALIITFFNILR